MKTPQYATLCGVVLFAALMHHAPPGASYGEDAPGMTLYVPPLMIQGIEYEGMILLREPASHRYDIRLASDGDITLPEGVSVGAGRNHGIFPIYPAGMGDFEVSAVSPDGSAVRAATKIFENPDSARLSIILPNVSTRIPDIPALLYYTDGLGNPLRAEEDIPVQVALPPSITSNSEATIPKGKYHDIVDLSVYGTGSVRAALPGAPWQDHAITKHHDNTRVRVGLAPNPAPAGSVVSYFVWIERDGTLYLPPAPIDVYVTSDDPEVAGPHPGLSHSMHHQKAKDDILHGFLYTAPASGPDDLRLPHDDARITVSVPGIGSDTAVLNVGPQPPEAKSVIMDALSGCVLENSLIHEGRCGRLLQVFAMVGGQAGEISGDHTTQRMLRAAAIQPHPDSTKMWAFPDIAHDYRWLVAGFYHTIPDTDVTIPTPAPDSVYLALSEGEGRPALLEPHRMIGPLQALLDSPGMVDATLSGPGFAEGRMRIEGPPPIPGRLHVEPLPSPQHMRDAPLALVSILDWDGHIVRPDSRMDDIIITGSGGIRPEYTTWRGGAAIIHGDRDGDGSLHARMDPYAPHSVQISGSGLASGIHLWMPDSVHVSEEFPIVLHGTDHSGVPLFRIYDSHVSSTFASAAPLSRMVAERAPERDDQGAPGGRVAALWHSMADWQEVYPFYNTMGPARIEYEHGTIPLGQNITVRIVPPVEGARVTIQGSIPYTQDGERYTAHPSRSGTYHSNITLSRPGWESAHYSIQHTVDQHVHVWYDAHSGAGSPPAHQISLSLGDSRRDIHSGTGAALPPGAYLLHAPSAIPSDREGVSYRLQEIRVDGSSRGALPDVTIQANGDTRIESFYQRMVLIRAGVEGGHAGLVEGAGLYPHGHAVTVRAESAPQWWGLVWSVPEEWSGLPRDAVRLGEGAASFEADEPAIITIRYEESYGVLVAAAAAAASAPPVIFRDRLADMIRGMRE